jgi:O-antigen/teichoic acid export membrane protein
MLEKELRFNSLAKQEILSTVFGVFVAIASALWGLGVWSLVWGQLAAVGIKTILLLQIGWTNWRPRIHFKTNDLEGYLSFGLYQMAERSINYFNSKVDQLLVGYLLGTRELGYYNFAFILVLEPVSRINPIMTRVAFPVFSKIQQDVKLLKHSYIKMLNLLSSVNAPLLIGMIAVAPIIIPVIFGSQWIPAILLVQILAFFSLIRSTGNPVGSLLLAKGRADLGFRWNLALFFITTPVIYIGAKIGNSIGIAISLVLLQILYFSANYKYLVEPLIGKCVRQYALSIFKPSIFAIIMGLCVWLLTFSGMKSVVWLAIYVFSGVTIYILLLWVFDRGIVMEFKGLFRRAE